MQNITGARQLSLGLAPQNPYSLASFVPHTGVSLAFEMVRRRIEELVIDPEHFRILVFHGPEGSGKTHLLHAAGEFALSKGLAASSMYAVEFEQSECLEEEEAADWATHFVASYDRLKRDGGLLLSSTATSPTEMKNPHVRSRLLAGDVVKLTYPQESELPPLLLSLLERRNLKLPESSLRYLVKRLPLSPLSFANIFDKIYEFSSSTNRPAKLGLVREVVSHDE